MLNIYIYMYVYCIHIYERIIHALLGINVKTRNLKWTRINPYICIFGGFFSTSLKSENIVQLDV